MEVSLCTTVTASTGPYSSKAARNSSAENPCPHSVSTETASFPHDRAISNQRFEKAPQTRCKDRSRTPLRMAASIMALAGAVSRQISPVACIKRPKLWRAFFQSRAHSGARWPIAGLAIWARTSGATSVGPGMKSLGWADVRSTGLNRGFQRGGEASETAYSYTFGAVFRNVSRRDGPAA